ncbi:hypothetical protein EDB84DRAFT_1642688 [Lactarius hengduanensis]|nr:hypothetical protein EDB84DRAFT_1642688 [Lactarius hengduanensis]
MDRRRHPLHKTLPSPSYAGRAFPRLVHPLSLNAPSSLHRPPRVSLSRRQDRSSPALAAPLATHKTPSDPALDSAPPLDSEEVPHCLSCAFPLFSSRCAIVPEDRPTAALEGHRIESHLVVASPRLAASDGFASRFARISSRLSPLVQLVLALVRSHSHRLSPSQTLRTRPPLSLSVTPVRNPLRLRTHTDSAPYSGYNGT